MVASMSSTVNAHVAADADLLLDYVDAKGLDGAVQVNPGQAHLGGLIVDSALQRRQRYASVVAPRVAKLITAWPDADTTTGFRTRLGAPDESANLDPAATDTATPDQTGPRGLGGLGTVLNWYSPDRLVQMAQTADVFTDHGIDTTADLGAKLEDEATRQPLHRALQGIHHVGSRTLDYLDILCGITPALALGSRLQLAANRAGITLRDDGHLKAVMSYAANLRDWPVADLDAVLWASHAS
jgi:hypothetical protein